MKTLGLIGGLRWESTVLHIADAPVPLFNTTHLHARYAAQ